MAPSSFLLVIQTSAWSDTWNFHITDAEIQFVFRKANQTIFLLSELDPGLKGFVERAFGMISFQNK